MMSHSGDLDAPAAARVAEDARVLLQRERVLAEQLRLDPAFERRRVGVPGRPPADDALIGGQLDQRRGAVRPRRSWRPGGPHRFRKLWPLQMNDLELSNTHESQLSTTLLGTGLSQARGRDMSAESDMARLAVERSSVSRRAAPSSCPGWWRHAPRPRRARRQPSQPRVRRPRPSRRARSRATFRSRSDRSRTTPARVRSTSMAGRTTPPTASRPGPRRRQARAPRARSTRSRMASIRPRRHTTRTSPGKRSTRS